MTDLASSARPTVRRGIIRVLGDWFERNFAFVTLSPALIVSLAVFALPLGLSLYLSFMGWSLNEPIAGGRFVGFDNYVYLFGDPAFRSSLQITLSYTFITVALQVALGLGMALMLNVDLPFIRMFRTALIVPMMMTPVVAALIWKMLLDPQYGIIDYLIGSPILWLGDPKLAFVSISLVSVWQSAPYVAILMLAGLRTLPPDVLEAASVDGANRLQTFLFVTLPLLRPHIVVAVLLRTIFEFRSFENAYVLTSGGPAGATTLISIYTYVTSFQMFDMSLAAAASWVTLLIALFLCVAFVLIVRRRENY